MQDTEKQRLRALQNERILDTLPGKSFDDLTRLAAFICGTPISLVSLVDESRQWFKSKVGLNVAETSRDLAFCSHAILQKDEVLLVSDATLDERFSSNALVTDDPKIRFYAGAPLITREGFALGTLCVIDRVPRILTNDQIEALQTLRDQVIRELELRRSRQELALSFSLLQESKDGYQRLAESLEESVRERTDELHQRNREILDQANALHSLNNRLTSAQDEERRRLARELHDSAGQLLAAVSINLDTILQQSSSVSSTMIRAAEESRDLVSQLSSEIRTMSYLLHPPLLDEAGLTAAIKVYLAGIENRSSLRVTLDVASDFVRFQHDLELLLFRVIQECLTNVHRHAACKTAKIFISLHGQEILVQVEDDGKGIPEEKLKAIRSHGSGLGMQGMQERVRQFGGRMEVHSSSKGTRVEFTVPFVPQTEWKR